MKRTCELAAAYFFTCLGFVLAGASVVLAPQQAFGDYTFGTCSYCAGDSWCGATCCWITCGSDTNCLASCCLDACGSDPRAYASNPA
jgi:hypothetical protein